MSIDTGSTISYNPAFPVQGINQNSKGFRDNFAIIKVAIERLQSAASSANSLFEIATTQSADGAIQFNVGFKGNAFKVPVGDPLIAPETGMVRFSSGVLQVYSGSSWVAANALTFSSIVSTLGYTPAPTNSPALTGVPTAPTAARGTNTNQIATTAYVRGEFAQMIGAAPETLNAIDELSAALGNNANFAADTLALIGTKAAAIHSHAEYVSRISATTGSQTGGDLLIRGGAGITTSLTNNVLTIALAASAASHGNLGGGTLHAEATPSTAGFMSAADKSKLDNIGGTGLSFSRMIIQNDQGLNIRDASQPNDAFVFKSSLPINLTTTDKDVTIGFIPNDASHGQRAGGNLHPIAIPNGTPGFMSGGDKAKLDLLTTALASANAAGYMSPADKRRLDQVTGSTINHAFTKIVTPNGDFQAEYNDTIRFEGTGGIEVLKFPGSGEKTIYLNLKNIGNRPITDILSTVQNYNKGNDRNGTAIVNPVVATDGTAVDHTIQTNGSADISFEWTWTGAEDDIDGFIIYLRSSDNATPYVFLSAPSQEQTFIATPQKRSFIAYGVSPNSYYTFFVQAYRMVDADIAPNGIIKSEAIGCTRTEENPYRPSANVAFGGDITGTVAGVAASTVANNAVDSWGKFNGVGNTLPAGNVEFNFAASGSKGGAATNSLSLGSMSAEQINESVINFSERNDRNGDPIINPNVQVDGTAVDHTLNADGSCNISFEWTWSGSNTDIDGWIVYLYPSADSSPYALGTSSALENVYYVTPEKRGHIILGAPVDRYYTFYVQAYRVVDPDISSTGFIRSAAVKSNRSEENPYRPSSAPVFLGDIQGSISGTAASTVASNAVNAWSKFTGTGNTLPAGAVDFNFAASGSKGGNALNTDFVGSQQASTIQTAVINFNDRNDRDGSPVAAPLIPNDGSAIDHTLNADGSCNMTFEWAWAGDNASIDGFIAIVYQSTSNAPYVLGTYPTLENVYYVSPEKRAIILMGMPVDRYYTIYVQAYRIVDADVAQSGDIRSTPVKSSRAEENPYRPSQAPVYTGDVTGTIAGKVAATVATNAVDAWGKFNGVANTLPAGNVEFNFAASGSKGGNALNTEKVGTQNANTVQNAVINFNDRNDRNGSAISDPLIPNDGTAIDHTINTDGSANISFEWAWGGVNADIDGFIVYTYQSTSNAPYTKGADVGKETAYYVTPDKRGFITYGVPADRYYTFFVQAYRIVDTDINPLGFIRSGVVKSSRGEENPYQPSTNVAFGGNVTGTVAGVSASTVTSNAVDAWSKFSGAGNTLPAGNVEFNFAASGSKGGNALNTDKVGNQTAETIQSSIINFNDRNDRNGNPIAAPILPSGGETVDHTVNTDGSANVSFEWTWSGANNDIDGFIVFTVQSTSASAYDLGSNPDTEVVYYVTPEKRAFILYGVPADQYYTMFVCAYRVVDSDINASGYIRSAVVKSTFAGENPYRPSNNVSFLGDVNGTVAGTAAGTVRDSALGAWSKFTGVGNTLPAGNVAFNFASSSTKGGSALNTEAVGNIPAAKIQETVLNFDSRNDRNGAAIINPIIVGDGSAVDHVLNSDGSCDVSFEWVWGGAQADIDGFIMTLRVTGDASAYEIGSRPTEEVVYYITPEKRGFILSGVPVDRYYTFYVQAYRIVDFDVSPTGVIKSSAIKSARGEENPYRPATAPVFTGDITGTLSGTSVTTVLANITNLQGRVTQTEGAITDLKAGTADAFWKVEVNAGANATSFISARARISPTETSSNVSFGAREVAIFNPTVNGWKRVFYVENGEVVVDGKLRADSIETNMLKVGSVTTGTIAANSVGVPYNFQAPDGYVASWGQTIAETPDWVSCGDGTDGGGIVQFSCLADSGTTKDKKLRVWMYLDTGGGYQLVKYLNGVGARTNGGDTNIKATVHITHAFTGSGCRVRIDAQSFEYMTETPSGNFTCFNPNITILGAKR